MTEIDGYRIELVGDGAYVRIESPTGILQMRMMVSTLEKINAHVKEEIANGN